MEGNLEGDEAGPPSQLDAVARIIRLMSLRKKLVYANRILPSAIWRSLRPAPRGRVHLVIAMADHFEPGLDPTDGQKFAPLAEQERRLEWWSREYPAAAEPWRDHDGRPFVHTYFYPAEQYEEGLLEMLADHCHAGWGEVEVHLHHGVDQPDTAANTRRLLTEFRDHLAFRHRCLALEEGSDEPRYAFVHGNFALANSADGRFCGVDSEMQILADTGCYADFTLPTGLFHFAQISKLNSLYECTLPLEQSTPHREGMDLAVGREPRVFPLIVQGALLADWKSGLRSPGRLIEASAVTGRIPMSVRRLALWKKARITVQGRPDWVFIKLHCHGMDPTQRDSVLGDAFRQFLQEMVTGAPERKEILHFVSAREMTNIILAACNGKDGNPGDYRDYRFKQILKAPEAKAKAKGPALAVKGS